MERTPGSRGAGTFVLAFLVGLSLGTVLLFIRPFSPAEATSPTTSVRSTGAPLTPTATMLSMTPAASLVAPEATVGTASQTIVVPVSLARPLQARNLITRANPELGIVALTFDAGLRDPGSTAQVLDELDRLGIKATIFLTGEWSEANPALVARMAAAGHELGNHTYDHPRLPQISEAEILAQISRTEEIVRRLTGRELVKDIRPPYGEYDGRLLSFLEEQGYDAVYWTIDSGDWRPEVTPADMIAKVGTQAKAGDVVVFHIYVPKTAEALPAILETWRERGLRAGTLGEALGR